MKRFQLGHGDYTMLALVIVLALVFAVAGIVGPVVVGTWALWTGRALHPLAWVGLTLVFVVTAWLAWRFGVWDLLCNLLR